MAIFVVEEDEGVMEPGRVGPGAGRLKHMIYYMALSGVLLTPLPAKASDPPLPSDSSTVGSLPTTTTQPKVRLIEWNLPAQGDSTPGAVIVDTMGHDKDRMWFVTRDFNPNLYRVEFPRSLMKGNAKWTSWKLNAITTGGLRRLRASWDRRFIFIRTLTPDLGESVESVDTDPTKCPGANCQTTVYTDNTVSSLDVSDVAVDNRNNVFTTHTPNFDLAQSYVQRLTPNGSAGASVTRWTIPGSGAGLCGDIAPGDMSVNTPCISGIAVHPTNQNLVYFSEPGTNSIGELNIASNPPTVRHWSLTTLSSMCQPTATILCNAISGPRQLHIDKRGKVWVVTGSGDLVSLDPCTSRMTRHELPDNVLADPFSLAPDDDAVGYTSSRTNKVGMMLPKGTVFYVPPSPPAGVDKTTIKNFPAETNATVCNSGYVGPIGKTVVGQVTKKEDGTFIEAKIDTGTDDNGKASDSSDPLGITAVRSKAQGTFFFTVGRNTSETLIDRVGFVRLPVREKIRFPRDDDDENDGKDGDHSWHDWHNHAEGDEDDDGVESEHDHHDARERDARENDTAVDDGVVPAGASKDYTMVTLPSSLALVAVTTTEDPLAQVGIDILDSRGLLVARSIPTPGVAAVEVLLPVPGTYTCRIRNYGATSIVQMPKLLIREPWTP